MLDTSYLLPMFGIIVKDINEGVFLKLRNAAIKGIISVYYSNFSLLEIVAKISKEKSKGGKQIEPDEVETVLRIIRESEYMNPVQHTERAFALAYKLRILGHQDLIDNILYATASVESMLFLTLDKKFRRFINKHSISGAPLVTHNELFSMLKL